jgi:glycosyl transferase family 87
MVIKTITEKIGKPPFKLAFLFWFIIIVTIGATLQKYFLGIDHIKNFLIFKNSFFNLINDKDFYTAQRYENMDIDLYKYSPAFALLFAPLAILPNVIGVVLWNLLNTLLLFFAIKSLNFDEKKKAIIFWLVFIEMLTSIQNCQSNALIAALIIFAFTLLERKKLFLAAFCIVFSAYIKLFGIVAVILFLFYPDKLKFILYTILWAAILFFLPLLVVSFHQLIFLYQSWGKMLAEDQTISWGLSVMGIIKSWFNVEVPKMYVQIVGVIILCLPLLSIKSWREPIFRILYLSSVMIWVVIFNHRAESPTFIIALCGMAIWFVSQNSSPMNIFLIIFALVLTSLSPTDLFPKIIRDTYVVPYALKALPALLIWIVIQYKLFSIAFKSNKSLS